MMRCFYTAMALATDDDVRVKLNKLLDAPLPDEAEEATKNRPTLLALAELLYVWIPLVRSLFTYIFWHICRGLKGDNVPAYTTIPHIPINNPSLLATAVTATDIITSTRSWMGK